MSYPTRAALALSILFLGISPPAKALTVEEATTGAVAAVLVAEKCYPARVAEASQYATADLRRMLSSLPPAEQEAAMDAASDKLKAMRISGSNYDCAGVVHFKAMARNWGFGHLILD